MAASRTWPSGGFRMSNSNARPWGSSIGFHLQHAHDVLDDHCSIRPSELQPLCAGRSLPQLSGAWVINPGEWSLQPALAISDQDPGGLVVRDARCSLLEDQIRPSLHELLGRHWNASPLRLKAVPRVGAIPPL